MKSLLLGRDDDDAGGRYRYDSGTGYVWMEFGDGDGPRHDRQSAPRPTAAARRRAWFFVTPLRVGHELDLADDDVPQGQRQLVDRLAGRRGVHHRRGLPHRGRPRLLRARRRRYRRLVDLLLTLRRPHLAGKLDTDHLSATLSAGLGELDSRPDRRRGPQLRRPRRDAPRTRGRAESLAAVERFLPLTATPLGAARQRARGVVDGLDALPHWSASSTARTRARRSDGAGTVSAQALPTDRRVPLAEEIENIRTRPPTRTPPPSMRWAVAPKRSGRPSQAATAPSSRARQDVEQGGTPSMRLTTTATPGRSVIAGDSGQSPRPPALNEIGSPRPGSSTTTGPPRSSPIGAPRSPTSLASPTQPPTPRTGRASPSVEGAARARVEVAEGNLDEARDRLVAVRSALAESRTRWAAASPISFAR